MRERPNILFIIADDHRFDAIRACGDPVVQTPVLDALAEGGTTFTQAHIMGGFVAAVCVPSRACLLTGADIFHASSSNLVDDYAGAVALNPERSILPAVLRQAGYHTHGIGKWHNDKVSFAKSFMSGANIFFGGMSQHRQTPMHDFDPAGLYPPEASRIKNGFSTELFSDSALRFLREYQGDNPFFLYLSYTAPHDPRTPPPDYANLYDPHQIPLPDNFMPEHPFDNGELRVRDELLAPWPRTPDVIRRHIADYYGMISHLDAQIGRVLAALRETGRADSTIVVYTADHGLAVGQHGLLGKQNLYEHSVRIPMILSGPNLPSGMRVQALTYLADLFPTLCDLSGTPVPDSVERSSLVPLMTGTREHGREYVFAAYKDVQRMVSDGRWKLIRYYQSSEQPAGTDHVQLFNLTDDPWETQNLATDSGHESRLRELAETLAAWQQHVGDPLSGRPLAVD